MEAGVAIEGPAAGEGQLVHHLLNCTVYELDFYLDVSEKSASPLHFLTK